MTFDQIQKRLVERRQRTTTQAEMARVMGTFQSHVSQMEAAPVWTVLTLERYAAALGYEVVYGLKLREE